MTESKSGRLMCLALLVLGAPYISPYAVCMMLVYHNQKQLFGAGPLFQLIADLVGPVVAVLLLDVGLAGWIVCLMSIIGYLCKSQAGSVSSPAGASNEIQDKPAETTQTKLMSLNMAIAAHPDYATLTELHKCLTTLQGSYARFMKSDVLDDLKADTTVNVESLTTIIRQHLERRGFDPKADGMTDEYQLMVGATEGCVAKIDSLLQVADAPEVNAFHQEARQLADFREVYRDKTV